MPPASAVNNNSNNAAVQAAAKAEREGKLRGALKNFILKERQRKKEECEAKEREARLQQERDARECENNLALEETRSQIYKLEEQITDLRNQKQQLFLQLKKVLNEDENRKKQQKDNELFAMQQALQAQQANVSSAQVFMPPVRLHHQLPILQKQVVNNQQGKRQRSPSPPQSQQAYYKGAGYPQAKCSNQYQTSPSAVFYQTTSNGTPTSQTQADARLQALYPYNLPLRQGFHLELQAQPTVPVSKSDTPPSKQATQVFHINLDQPSITQADTAVSVATGTASNVPVSKPQVTMEKINDRYHIEVKHDASTGHVLGVPHVPEGVIYKPLITELQTNVLQIANSLAQNTKTTGSITQGYASGRNVAHEPQQARQQVTILPSQTGQPTTPTQQQQQTQSPPQTQSQQLQYTRRMF